MSNIQDGEPGVVRKLSKECRRFSEFYEAMRTEVGERGTLAGCFYSWKTAW
jgi:hypothetical protein